MRQIESIFWGIIAATSALFLEVLISTLIPILSDLGKESIMNFSSPLSFILIVSILIEEFLKYLVILKRIEKFSYGKSLITNSLLTGLGFSFMELALIYGNFHLNANRLFEPKDLFGLFLIHILTAGIIGYFIAACKNGKYAIFLKAFISASIIHFLYNFMIIWQNEFAPFLIFILIGATTSFVLYNLISIDRKLAS